MWLETPPLFYPVDSSKEEQQNYSIPRSITPEVFRSRVEALRRLSHPNVLRLVFEPQFLLPDGKTVSQPPPQQQQNNSNTNSSGKQFSSSGGVRELLPKIVSCQPSLVAPLSSEWQHLHGSEVVAGVLEILQLLLFMTEKTNLRFTSFSSAQLFRDEKSFSSSKKSAASASAVPHSPATTTNSSAAANSSSASACAPDSPLRYRWLLADCRGVLDKNEAVVGGGISATADRDTMLLHGCAHAVACWLQDDVLGSLTEEQRSAKMGCAAWNIDPAGNIDHDDNIDDDGDDDDDDGGNRDNSSSFVSSPRVSADRSNKVTLGDILEAWVRVVNFKFAPTESARVSPDRDQEEGDGKRRRRRTTTAAASAADRLVQSAAAQHTSVGASSTSPIASPVKQPQRKMNEKSLTSAPRTAVVAASSSSPAAAAVIAAARVTVPLDLSSAAVKNYPDAEKQRLLGRLRLFYSVHAPDNVAAAERAVQFTISEAAIVGKMCEKYKVDAAAELQCAASQGLLPTWIKWEEKQQQQQQEQHAEIKQPGQEENAERGDERLGKAQHDGGEADDDGDAHEQQLDKKSAAQVEQQSESEGADPSQQKRDESRTEKQQQQQSELQHSDPALLVEPVPLPVEEQQENQQHNDFQDEGQPVAAVPVADAAAPENPNWSIHALRDVVRLTHQWAITQRRDPLTTLLFLGQRLHTVEHYDECYSIMAQCVTLVPSAVAARRVWPWLLRPSMLSQPHAAQVFTKLAMYARSWTRAGESCAMVSHVDVCTELAPQLASVAVLCLMASARDVYSVQRCNSLRVLVAGLRRKSVREGAGHSEWVRLPALPGLTVPMIVRVVAPELLLSLMTVCLGGSKASSNSSSGLSPLDLIGSPSAAIKELCSKVTEAASSLHPGVGSNSPAMKQFSVLAQQIQKSMAEKAAATPNWTEMKLNSRSDDEMPAPERRWAIALLHLDALEAALDVLHHLILSSSSSSADAVAAATQLRVKLFEGLVIPTVALIFISALNAARRECASLAQKLQEQQQQQQHQQQPNLAGGGADKKMRKKRTAASNSPVSSTLGSPPLRALGAKNNNDDDDDDDDIEATFVVPGYVEGGPSSHPATLQPLEVSSNSASAAAAAANSSAPPTPKLSHSVLQGITAPPNSHAVDDDDGEDDDDDANKKSSNRAPKHDQQQAQQDEFDPNTARWFLTRISILLARLMFVWNTPQHVVVQAPSARSLVWSVILRSTGVATVDSKQLSTAPGIAAPNDHVLVDAVFEPFVEAAMMIRPQLHASLSGRGNNTSNSSSNNRNSAAMPPERVALDAVVYFECTQYVMQSLVQLSTRAGNKRASALLKRMVELDLFLEDLRTSILLKRERQQQQQHQEQRSTSPSRSGTDQERDHEYESVRGRVHNVLLPWSFALDETNPILSPPVHVEEEAPTTSTTTTAQEDGDDARRKKRICQLWKYLPSFRSTAAIKTVFFSSSSSLFVEIAAQSSAVVVTSTSTVGLHQPVSNLIAALNDCVFYGTSSSSSKTAKRTHEAFITVSALMQGGSHVSCPPGIPGGIDSESLVASWWNYIAAPTGGVAEHPERGLLLLLAARLGPKPFDPFPLMPPLP